MAAGSCAINQTGNWKNAAAAGGGVPSLPARNATPLVLDRPTYKINIYETKRERDIKYNNNTTQLPYVTCVCRLVDIILAYATNTGGGGGRKLKLSRTTLSGSRQRKRQRKHVAGSRGATTKKYTKFRHGACGPDRLHMFRIPIMHATHANVHSWC